MFRRRLGCFIAASAVAVGAMTATTATADAKPIGQGTIKSECKKAGGTYSTSGNGLSSCTYRDIDGVKHTDEYVDGNYAGTH